MLKQNCRKKKAYGEFRHGVVRAIENLRRLRLSLVPESDPREGVLQSMRDKTEGLSNAGEQKAARAPVRKPLISVWAMAEAVGGVR